MQPCMHGGMHTSAQCDDKEKDLSNLRVGEGSLESLERVRGRGEMM